MSMIWGDFLPTCSMRSLCEDVDESETQARERKPAWAAGERSRKGTRWRHSGQSRREHTEALHLPTTFPGSPFPGNLPVVCCSHILRVPVVFLPSLPQGYRVLHGGGQGHRKCLLGACGPGQSWQQARGGKDILRSLRNLHSPLLLPPPLTPSFKGEERWGGGVKLQSQRPAACPGCGGQSRPWHWTGGPISTLLSSPQTSSPP